MDIQRTTIGRTSGNATQGPRPVDSWTLDSGRGLAVTVWTYGATLNQALAPDRAGRRDNVVVRLPRLADYADRAHSHYLGATLGRYARCVSNGRFQLDGVEYVLDRNAGRHHIHGGTDGFDRMVWDSDCELVGGAAVVRLTVDSPHGDQGYPGRLSAQAVYRLDADGRLTFDYSATTDASTIVAFTNHTYWNLAGRGGIDGHVLAINSGRVLPADEEHIPTGAPVSVAGTALDRRHGRHVGGQRLDHCFALDDGSWAAELCDPSTGRVMTVTTDQPGLGVHIADDLVRVADGPAGGVALQTGAWPDSPNRPDYPASRLEPGDTYTHRTTHVFTTR